jgi:hypothetical protein
MKVGTSNAEVALGIALEERGLANGMFRGIEIHLSTDMPLGDLVRYLDFYEDKDKSCPVCGSAMSEGAIERLKAKFFQFGGLFN